MSYIIHAVCAAATLDWHQIRTCVVQAAAAVAAQHFCTTAISIHLVLACLHVLHYSYQVLNACSENTNTQTNLQQESQENLMHLKQRKVRVVNVEAASHL
jgi:Tfp pilus assembly protein PilN